VIYKFIILYLHFNYQFFIYFCDNLHISDCKPFVIIWLTNIIFPHILFTSGKSQTHYFIPWGILMRIPAILHRKGDMLPLNGSGHYEKHYNHEQKQHFQTVYHPKTRAYCNGHSHYLYHCPLFHPHSRQPCANLTYQSDTADQYLHIGL